MPATPATDASTALPTASTALPTEVDVIVVGSSAGALTGAYTAAVGGLSVLVLEKTAFLGGTCAYSGAGLWFPGNHVLAREGIEDSVEAGTTYFRATVGDRTPRELQDAYLNAGPEVVRFLEDSGAMEFEYIHFPDYYEAPGRGRGNGRGITPKPLDGKSLGDALKTLRPIGSVDKFGQDRPRDVLTGGQSLIGHLMLALSRTGNAEVRVECPMESLVTVDGEVVGVVADGTEIRARRGVLLGAGGYDGNADLRREHHHGVPRPEWTCAPVGINTGDALAAAQSAGADVDLLDAAWWAPALLFPNGYASFLPIVNGGLMVGPDGRRFVNESLPYDQLGHAFLEKLRECGGSDAELWWVFDTRAPEIPGYCEPVDLEDPDAVPVMVTSQSLAGLAQQIGVPVDALEETVERFNKGAAEGVDADFGRGVDEFDQYFAAGDGPNPALVPIETGPYRAIRVVVSDLGSKGGARTNASGQVVRPGGDPIKGLYAVGGSAASVAGYVYPGPGVPLGSSMTFGYLAAKAMSGTV